MELLLDEEVFGTGTSPQPKMLSDEEVFGKGEAKLLSDEEVFGTKPPVDDVSSLRYGIEAGKRFLSSAKDTLAGQYLTGPAEVFRADEGNAYRVYAGKLLRAGHPYEEAKRMADEAQARGELIPQPIQETLLHSAGTAVKGFGKETLTPAPGFEKSVVGDIAGAFGSVAGNIGPALLGSAGRNVAKTMIPFGGADEAAERARREGQPEGVVAEAAKAGLTAGATDLVDLSLARAGFGNTPGAVKRVLSRLVTGGIVEGTQEGIQQFLQNVIAKGIYKPGQELSEDVLYSAFLGAVAGGGVKVLAGAIGDRSKEPPPPMTAENLAGAYRDVVQRPDSSGAPQADVQVDLTEEGGGAGSVHSLVAPGPVFYSQVKKVVEEKGPAVASAEQWAATIRQVPGVKAEEVEWLGIPDYLAERSGRISKKDLIAHLEENAVRVYDAVHEDRAGDLTWEKSGSEFTAPEAPGWRISVVPAEAHTDPMARYRVIGPRGAFPGLGLYGTLEAAQGFIAREVFGTISTQYADYTLPGGSNYREILMTLPVQTRTRVDIARGFGTKQVPDETETYRSPHFYEPNILAHMRTTDRVDSEGKQALFAEEIQSDWHQRGRKVGYGAPFVLKNYKGLVISSKRFNSVLEAHGYIETRQLEKIFGNIQVERAQNVEGRVPDAPFKTSWPELSFKRLLRWAADHGYERLAWTPGEVQIERYPGLTEGQKKGQKEFYDVILPRIAEKWARKLGAKTGKTRIPGEIEIEYYEVPFVDLTPEARSRIQRGLPMFSQIAPGISVEESATLRGEAIPHREGLVFAAKQSAVVISVLAKQMGIKTPITFKLVGRIPGVLGESDTIWGPDYGMERHIITISMGEHRTPEAVYATMAHEFGHIVMKELYARADLGVQLQIEEAFRKDYEVLSKEPSFASMIALRDNFISVQQRMRGTNDTSMFSMTPEVRQYWLGKEEWFAEEVAKWATTSARPLSVVDKFFSALGRQIRRVFEAFAKKFGVTQEPSKAMADWLDSLVDQRMFAHQVKARYDLTSQAANRMAAKKDGAEDFPSVSQTLSTQPARTAMKSLFGPGNVPPHVEAAAGYADKWHRSWKYLTDLVVLSDANPHIEPLQRYRADVEAMHTFALERHARAEETVKAAHNLPKEEQQALFRFIDSYINMRFLSPIERAAGVERRPTPAEFAKMAVDAKLSGRGLDVFRRMASDFDRFLTEAMAIVREKANAIIDPIAQAKELQRLAAVEAQLRKKPYFPAVRFGLFTVTVRDAQGNVISFERVETEREQRRLERAWRAKLTTGERIEKGKLPQSVLPFGGLPIQLMELLEERLSLSTAQREALQQLKYEVAPIQSFAHRFQHRKLVPGYSKDFIRAYAHYFFHGNRYLARAQYFEQLEGAVADLWASSRNVPDGVKRAEIAQFAQDHFADIRDPKADWTIPRAVAFHLYLGYMVSSAGVNLMQSFISTYPFLAYQFGRAGMGDVRAWKAIAKAALNVKNFYKESTIKAMTGPEMRAMNELIRLDVLDPSQAVELAGLSEGNNLIKGYGGNVLHQAANAYLKGSSFLFSLAEKANRRVAAMATYDLAMKFPDNAFVKKAVKEDPEVFLDLTRRGLPTNEAAAITAAKRAVGTTQFQYATWARPRYAKRGVGSAIFVFKIFLHKMLWNMYNYPGMRWRSLLMFGLLGGMMGLPGAEDLKGLMKALAWWLFGKDFDIEDEARRFAVEVLGMKSPEYLVRGLGSRGYGISALLDMIGEFPYPVLDRSRAVSMGNVLPVDFGELLGPQASRDPMGGFAKGVAKGLGVPGGYALNVYKAIENSRMDPMEFKRWERVVPRWLASISQATRVMREGGERSSTGALMVRFDARDPEHMAEMLAMAMGYRPARSAEKWNQVIAEREAVVYWDLRRQMLLNQFWIARRGGDKEEIERVRGAIRGFNKEVFGTPARGKVITGQTIERSMQGRLRSQAAQETGTPRTLGDIPIARDIQRLYPNAEVDVRRIR